MRTMISVVFYTHKHIYTAISIRYAMLLTLSIVSCYFAYCVATRIVDSVFVLMTKTWNVNSYFPNDNYHSIEDCS